MFCDCGSLSIDPPRHRGFYTPTSRWKDDEAHLLYHSARTWEEKVDALCPKPGKRRKDAA